MKATVIVFLLTALMVATGCGDVQRRTSAGPTSDLENVDLIVVETPEISAEVEVAEIPPPPAPPVIEEEPVIAAVPSEEELPAEEPPMLEEPAAAPPEAAAIPLEMRFESGYRVQLLATTEADHARQFAESVRPLFEESIYVEYLEPYYKIRIGDCPTRMEANKLLRTARSAGFDEAWITATQILAGGEEQN